MSITEHLQTDKYVAFLDVLGFKEIVKTKGPKLDKYFDTIKNALQSIGDDKKTIVSQLVSDSIILSCPLTRNDLRLLFKAVQTIQIQCAFENIWIRGAISYGDIYIHENIVVGNGLSDAYVLETQAKFPRIIIDPRILRNDFGTKEIFIQEYNNTFVGPGSMHNKIPLIHYSGIAKKHIENDALFVAFAEKIYFDYANKIETIYLHIQEELYKGQTNYHKYLWLKNYFTEALEALAGSIPPDGKEEIEEGQRRWVFAAKFDAL